MANTKNILVPQMGEGLQEVRIIEFLKRPGEAVHRDDILYSMETDKATMEVESPYEGRLSEWLASEGDVLAIGAPIAVIEEGAASAQQTDVGLEAAANREEYPEPSLADMAQMRAAEAVGGPSLSSPVAGERPRRVSPLQAATGGAPLIPPRTRAYSRDLGISEEEMRAIHAATGKLMPSDVDAYLQSGRRPEAKAPASNGAADRQPRSGAMGRYVERPMDAAQRTFVMRIKRSQQIVVPAVLKRSIDWSMVRKVADARKMFGDLKPSAFQTFAYAVARATEQFPRFRSTLPTDDKIREYEHVNLGIAVGMPTGELRTAVVPDADGLGFDDFVRTAQTNIESARNGRDQAGESLQLLLTYMGNYEIEDAIPLLVAPAVAVLFISATFQAEGTQRVNLTLTFDHRLINGIEAAEFLKAISERARDVETWRTHAHPPAPLPHAG